jgi:hypothetical protein
MIISDLNHLEVISAGASVEGGSIVRSYTQFDKISIDFNSKNSFATNVNSPKTYSNSASAGAKGDAINNTYYPSYSFTKADTVAVTELGGGSFSASTSAAVINLIPFH